MLPAYFQYSMRLLGLLVLKFALTAPAAQAQSVDYVRDIRPILAKHCYECHGPDKQKSGLRLDTVAATKEGGYSGAAVVPGKSGESLLLTALTGTGDVPRMPEGRPPLSEAEIELVKAWIDQGAAAPTDDAPATAKTGGSKHWAFQPLSRLAAPAVSRPEWVRNEIDTYILARLEVEGLTPSPEADRTTLVRRLSLDLTGLLPSPAEVEEFLADGAADAYERLVDRLLASPRYGEKWARHWLDQARYADSNGYTIDSGRSIWKYRDWVIEALNRDMPFDQFTIEQMAGDMLPGATSEQTIATGFHRNTLRNEEGGTDAEQFRVESVADRVNTTASVFLGLTIGCARCHDHKYDPISQRDYYQFFALLNNADEPTLPVPTMQQSKEEPALLADIAQVEKRLGEVEANAGTRQLEWERKLTDESRAALPDALRQALAASAADRDEQQKKLVSDEFRKVDPELVPLLTVLNDLNERKKQLAAKTTSTLVMKERDEPRETFIHVRGDFLRRGAKVEPGVPAVFCSPEGAAAGEPGVGGAVASRLDLARWLVAPRQNPLTPRVTVNRVWQQYFGQGLVETDNDFGTQGSPPSHPELLDWLAGRFVDGGWGMKALHRLIVTSATYRQASVYRADLAQRDPANRLLARMPRLRLDAETIRDAALSASGLLSTELGGPGVYPPQPEGIYRFTQQAKFWKESTGGDRYRRGLYVFFWRSSPYPFLMTFDAPDANTACTRRARSNTPLQGLTLANDRVFVEAAQGLAARVLREAVSPSDLERIRHLFRLCFAREPSAREAARLSELLNNQRQAFAADAADAERVAGTLCPAEIPAVESAAWTALARVAINLDEFITRE
ncbi:MAG TPA: PSD1 and planctomycete cytochrome C domain-containing protein [Pirellulales bacterium]|nr:PSD1 and planctomycete cytochrome C domain-containing protein [Pirellulales bacterium]